MSPVLIFLLLLLLTFAILVWFLRPSQEEAAVKRQLSDIEGARALGPTGSNILKEEPVSAVPWLDSWLGVVPGGTWVARLIKQSGKTWQTSYLIAGALGAAIVAAWFASIFTSNTPARILAAVVGVIAPFLYLYIVREVRFNRFDALLPEAIDLMARALRAGHALPSIMEMIGQEVPGAVGFGISQASRGTEFWTAHARSHHQPCRSSSA